MAGVWRVTEIAVWVPRRIEVVRKQEGEWKDVLMVWRSHLEIPRGCQTCERLGPGNHLQKRVHMKGWDAAEALGNEEKDGHREGPEERVVSSVPCGRTVRKGLWRRPRGSAKKRKWTIWRVLSQLGQPAAKS